MPFLEHSDSAVNMVSDLKVLLKELFGPRYHTEVEGLLVEFKNATFGATLGTMVVMVDGNETVWQDKMDAAQNELMGDFFKRWSRVGEGAEVFSWRLEIAENDAVVFENVGIYSGQSE